MVADSPPVALDLTCYSGGGDRVINAKSAPSFQLNPTSGDQWGKIN